MIEQLKQQLDDSSGSHELLEQLTERNLTLTEVSTYSEFVDEKLYFLSHRKLKK
jgi:hypothetical protein